MNYYFDLGASDGDSIRRFLSGGILFMPDIRDWQIIGYEPVLYQADTWENLKAEYPTVNLQVHRAAAWIKSGKVGFAFCDNLESCTIVEECENYPKGRLDSAYAIDFEQVIMSIDANDVIIVKMDIEGAEYDLLDRLIETKAIKNINRLFVEFHDWIMPESYKARHQSIIERCPIPIEGWG